MGTTSRRSTREINETLLAIARDGVIRQEWAEQAGVSRQSIAARVESGVLERVRRGVVRFAGSPPLCELPRLDPSRQRTAVTVTGGYGLALWSANAWLGIESSAPQRVHVIVNPRSHVRDRAWYVAHRLRPLAAGDIVMWRGVPTTSSARTLRDFAAVLRHDDWASYASRWTEEALMLKVLDLRELEAQRDRESAIHVRRRLNRLVDHHSGRGTEDLRSRGEAWLRDTIERYGLPQPQFNAMIPGTNLEVDALWIAEQVALEYDSFQYHTTRPKLARDARRRRITSRHGFHAWNVTADDLAEPDTLADDLLWALRTRVSARTSPHE